VNEALHAITAETLQRWRTEDQSLDSLLTYWENRGIAAPGGMIAIWQKNIDQWDPKVLWQERVTNPYFDEVLSEWEDRGVKIPPKTVSSPRSVESLSRVDHVNTRVPPRRTFAP
jgi:hypothetical protein